MDDLREFNSPEFGHIRTITIGGEPWFVGRDVANALGYSNTRDAILNHVFQEDKMDGVEILDPIGRKQNPIFINESGLYALVFNSRLKTAKEFKRWVTHDVLPSIRRTGKYIVGQETTREQRMARAFLEAQQIIKELEESRKTLLEDNERMRPKEIFADAVSGSQTSILVGNLAKLICQNGYEIGQKRLFEWLRNNGYLIKRRGEDWNMPTQSAMEKGLFEIKESTRLDGNGCNITTRTPKVTGKGQIYFVNKFLRTEV